MVMASFSFGGDWMPSKPLHPCRHPGCTKLVAGKYCEKHRRDANAKSRAATARHAMYLKPEWKRLRATQLLREPWCRECAKRGRRVRATDVDHVIPHDGNEQLFTDKNNLQSLCHACHSRKTMAENRKNKKI